MQLWGIYWGFLCSLKCVNIHKVPIAVFCSVQSLAYTYLTNHYLEHSILFFQLIVFAFWFFQEIREMCTQRNVLLSISPWIYGHFSSYYLVHKALWRLYFHVYWIFSQNKMNLFITLNVSFFLKFCFNWYYYCYSFLLLTFASYFFYFSVLFGLPIFNKQCVIKFYSSLISF